MSQPGEKWVVALYDFDGKTEGELSFQLGDSILISWHVDAEWSCGRINSREGMFPRAFVESSSGMKLSQDRFDKMTYLNSLLSQVVIIGCSY